MKVKIQDIIEMLGYGEPGNKKAPYLCGMGLFYRFIVAYPIDWIAFEFAVWHSPVPNLSNWLWDAFS